MAEPASWHNSPFPPPDKERIREPLPSALARAVSLWPDRPALLHTDRSFSFADLAGRAAGLAEQIQHADIAPGPVALLQSVGPDAVAAWFACPLAGRAFLLLDPSHPPARLGQLIDAAAARAVVCDARTAGCLPDMPAVRRVIPHGQSAPWHPWSELNADDPAMIFPTSGSTGTPKLVVYSSRTLQVKVQASITLMRIPPAARVVIAGSHANYGFVHHSLVFLMSGGTVCLADVKADGFPAVIDAIAMHEARHARFTPSMFRVFAGLPEARGALRSLAGVRFSGETLLESDLDLAGDVLDPGCLVQNVYGSTESALFIWTRGDDAPAGPTVPVGHIYPGSSYAVRPLDDASDDGMTGELVIRSTDHALGDLHAGVVDGTRFETVSQVTGERVYATGDIVRRLPGGEVVVVGRMDRMVKLRGQRVFLAEVENHLRAMPGVSGAAAIDVSGPAGLTLYGFVTRPRTAEPFGDARAWLAGRLPDFMIPSRVLVVPDIPLLPGGKTDFEAIRALVPRHEREADALQAAVDPSERLLHAWTSLLGPGADDLDNDFFTLGGDSLALMELSLVVEREFARRFPVEQFLADPTLLGLARLVGVSSPRRTVAMDGGIAPEKPIRLRPIWAGRKPSRGIALGMPGWHGSAVVFPFVRAGLFPDHDVWAADASVRHGTMLVAGKWWRTAVEIAARLRDGAMPTPRVLFGFSVGGSIAWLVGRLLAGTTSCPEFVLMIDPAPLHRLAAHRDLELDNLLSSAAATLPAVLHIHRSSLAHVGLELGRSTLWRAEDNVRLSIGIPTIAHDDMIRSDVLALVADGISCALDGGQQASASAVEAESIDTLGVHIHRLLSDGDARGRPRLDAVLREAIGTSSHDYVPAVLYVTLRDGTRAQARQVLDAMIARHPGSRLLRYARNRLDRRRKGLRPGLDLVDVTQCFLSVPAIEKALASHDAAAVDRWSGPSSRLVQLFDMLRAAVAAAPHRTARARRAGQEPGAIS